MKRPVLKLAVALALVTLVSACTIIVEPPVRQPDATENAGNNPAVPVHNVQLAAGESYLIRVNVGAVGADLLYLELNQNIDLEVFSPTRNRIASSSSSGYFGVGGTGLATAGLADATLEPQELILTTACRGSCVILDREESTHSHYFALITNRSGASRSVQFFAFGDQFDDEWERSNDSTSTLAVIAMASGGESGAIETIGDIDWWRIVGNGTVEFVANNPALDIRFDLYAANGTTLVRSGMVGGDSTDVFNNEFVRVRTNNNRAGAAAASQYHFLTTLAAP